MKGGARKPLIRNDSDDDSEVEVAHGVEKRQRRARGAKGNQDSEVSSFVVVSGTYCTLLYRVSLRL